MSDYRILALKAHEAQASQIVRDLNSGVGRFGWSYIETGDLRKLQARIASDGYDSLSDAEKDCYQAFLLDLRPDDWVVYINVPTYGMCTCARVVSSYYWEWKDADFNHRFSVDPVSVRSFNRNDAIVHPALSARLKLQGRHWQISRKSEFESLLTGIEAGNDGRLRDDDDAIRRLTQQIAPDLLSITRNVQDTHPNYALERLFERVFKEVPGVVDVRRQGGAGDRGADLLVTIERIHPLTGQVEQSLCVVQIKSYTGDHDDLTAISDIRRAFVDNPEASAGLIISTADRATGVFLQELEKLREEGKGVSLLIGPDVAVFVLRYGARILR